MQPTNTYKQWTTTEEYEKYTTKLYLCQYYQTKYWFGMISVFGFHYRSFEVTDEKQHKKAIMVR